MLNKIIGRNCEGKCCAAAIKMSWRIKSACSQGGFKKSWSATFLRILQALHGGGCTIGERRQRARRIRLAKERRRWMSGRRRPPVVVYLLIESAILVP